MRERSGSREREGRGESEEREGKARKRERKKEKTNTTDKNREQLADVSCRAASCRAVVASRIQKPRAPPRYRTRNNVNTNNGLRLH